MVLENKNLKRILKTKPVNNRDMDHILVVIHMRRSVDEKNREETIARKVYKITSPERNDARNERIIDVGETEGSYIAAFCCTRNAVVKFKEK